MKHLVITALLLMNTALFADWVPPPNPDLQQILNEAREDARAQRYEDALAKHVWFHENALRITPSMVGVRLSFALSYWAQLAEVYPPALVKLESARDEAAKEVREGKGTRESFSDFAAINKTLKDEGRTKELFVWLDANKPEVAKEVFNRAEPALIKTKEYQLCGRYVKGRESYESMVQSYRRNQKLAEQPRFGDHLKSFGEQSFSNSAATLVALLVINGRKAEAEPIALEAAKEWADPQFKELLDKALKGEVPDPWP